MIPNIELNPTKYRKCPECGNPYSVFDIFGLAIELVEIGRKQAAQKL
jgi:hypothetical protein